jgi:hypothetical protein
VKVCTICHETKDESEFNNKSRNKDGLQEKCRECSRRLSRKHYHNDKKAQVNRVSKRKKLLAKWYQELKASFKCEICGENTKECLDLHHKDPKKKEGGISMLVNRGFSKERLLKEIAKCAILCSNCHRKIHSGRISLPS